MRSDSDYAEAREAMVRQQIMARGISSPSVLAAFRKVPRHRFLTGKLQIEAYEDRAIPLGPGQSISQPYIVARMLDRLNLSKADKVLEIGTGTGYQSALLAELCKEVYSIDIHSNLVSQAEELLSELGYSNVVLASRDGFKGFPEFAPFDAIVVAAAPTEIPRELVSELGPKGRMVLPLGNAEQVLVYIERRNDTLFSEELDEVRFVAMRHV